MPDIWSTFEQPGQDVLNQDWSSYTGGGGGGWGSALDLGALGLAGGALGFMAAKGPAELPPQFQQLQANVPWLQINANELLQQGKGLTTQGAEALAMAQRGELTAPQKAKLDLMRTAETNRARQTYAAMGRTPETDTSYIQTQQNIDTVINAASEEQIRSTIALGTAELQGGQGLIGDALQFDTAANNVLLALGNAQLKNDADYNKNLTDAFSSIAKMAGQILPALAFV